MKLAKQFQNKLAQAKVLIEEIQDQVQEQLDKENEKDNPNEDKIGDLEVEFDKFQTALDSLDEVEYE